MKVSGRSEGTIFDVVRTSDYKHTKTGIEIQNLDGLLKWIDEQNSEIIISKDDDGFWSLEIYDDYRE